MGQQQNPNQLDTRVEPKRAMEAKCDDFIGQKLGDRRRIPAGSSWGRNPLAFLFKSERKPWRIRRGERVAPEPPPPPCSVSVCRFASELGLGTGASRLTGKQEGSAL